MSRSVSRRAPSATTLGELVGALKPRFRVVGQPRLGPSSTTADLSATLKARANCEVLVVPGAARRRSADCSPGCVDWLAGDLGIPSGHTR